MDTELTYPVNRLIEACEPMLLFINQIRTMDSANLGDMDSFRKRVLDQLGSMEQKARNLGVSAQETHLAKYAIVVFLDEIVLASSWDERDLWEAEPLQLELFGNNTGGIDFFTEIDNIQKAGYNSSDLTELYYLCLILGFEGDYVDDPMELIKTKNQLIDVLMKNPGYESELSPSWKREDTSAEIKKKKLSKWMVPVFSVVFLIVLYVTCYYLIGNYADEIVKALYNLVPKVDKICEEHSCN